MKSLKIRNSLLVIAVGAIIEQLAWPGTTLLTLLGPAFLLGVGPLLALSPRQYIMSMLASALIGILTGGYVLTAIVILHFSLWYWAHKKQHIWYWAVSILLPISLLVWQQSERTYLTYLLALGSAACQMLLYRTLTSISQHKIRQLQEEHYHRQGADRFLAASTHSRQLGMLAPIGQALNATMEQTYAAYQDIEMLARTDPKLPQPLAQRLLAAAQQIHRNRLQLQEWREEQTRTLHELVGRETVSLRTVCNWIAIQTADAGGRNGQQVNAIIDLSDDTLLTKTEQLPLASLLLFICQDGLAQQTAAELSVRFSGYVAGEGMRLIVTFAPESDQPSGEWPELAPCDVGSVSDYAEQLNAFCCKGITSQGEHIYTLELR